MSEQCTAALAHLTRVRDRDVAYAQLLARDAMDNATMWRVRAVRAEALAIVLVVVGLVGAVGAIAAL